MKQYRPLAIITIIILELILIFQLTGQVRLHQLEKSSTKWLIPAAYRVLPDGSQYHLKYISPGALLDSVGITTGGGGTVKGTGVATRFAWWVDVDSLSSDADAYWDNTNKRVGIGDTAPAYKLDTHHNSVSTSGTSVPIARVSATPTTDDAGIGLVVQNKRTAATDMGAFIALLNGSGNYSSNTSNAWRMYNQMNSSSVSEFVISSQTTAATTWTHRMYISDTGVPRFPALAATSGEQSVILSSDTGVLSDISGATNGQILKYDGDSWELSTDNNSGGTMSSWLLAASGTGGTASITDGATVTITAGTGITATRSGSNVTVTNSAPNVTTNLTMSGSASPYTLNSSDGSDVTYASGTGIGLSRSGDQLTITNNGDLDGTNEGYIGINSITAGSAKLVGGYYIGGGSPYGYSPTGTTITAGTGGVTFSGVATTNLNNNGSLTISVVPSYGRLSAAEYDQTFPATTWTAFNGFTSALSGGTGITPNTSTDRIDCIAGDFEIAYSCGFEATASGTAIFALMIEGSINTITQRTLTVVSGNRYSVAGTFILTLSANDSVGIAMYPSTTHTTAEVEDASLTIKKLF